MFMQEALVMACQHGVLAKVKELVSAGVSVNIGDGSFHYSPLDKASEFGHLEIVKYLVDNGANVTACDNWAVRYACKKGHIDVVKYLISKGADPLDYDNHSIRMACEHGHLELVKYLVSQGTDTADKRLWWLAWESGHLDVIKYLADLGLDAKVFCGLAVTNVKRFDRGDMVNYIVDSVLNEMKKYALLLLLNRKRIINRDLVGFIISRLVKYRERYADWQK